MSRLKRFPRALLCLLTFVVAFTVICISLFAANLNFAFANSEDPEFDTNFDKTLAPGETYYREAKDGCFDRYDMKVPSNGYAYFVVTVEDDAPEESVWLKAQLSCSSELYHDEVSLSRYIGTRETMRVSGGSVKKIYLNVQVSSWRPDKKAWYTVKAVSVIPKHYCSEPDDSRTNATRLLQGETFQGLASNHDWDWHVFKAPSDGIYTVTVSAVRRNGTSGKIYLFTWLENNRTNIDLNMPIGGGDKDSRRGNIALKKGQRLYLRTSDTEGANEQSSRDYNVLYKLRVDGLSTIPPVIKKVVSKKETAIKVQWSRQPHVSGYQVRCSTNKSMRNSKTIKVKGAKNTKAVFKGLKNNNRYYLQIRPYLDTFDYEKSEYDLYGNIHSTWHRVSHCLSWSKPKALYLR